ncbi:MAG: hypothetical protein P1V81_10095 [Planctomycetota bacterium]|nr:hypothetical protein [Planctomycetota bacterium]
MDSARKLIAPLLFSVFVVLVLVLCGLLSPASGAAPWSSLLYGHLDDPGAAALGRAAGLGLVAVTLFLRPGLLPRGPVQRGLLLALVGLLVLVVPPLLPTWLNAAGGLTRLLVGGLCLAALLPLTRGAKAATVVALPEPQADASADADLEEAGDAPELDGDPRPGPVQLLGEVLAGAGLALALGAVWSRLALFGYHGAEEQHLRAAVLLAMVGIGSLAFGPMLLHVARGARAIAPAVVAVGALVGLSLLAQVQTREPLETLLRGFGGLDLGAIGGTKGTAILAARTLFLPGFALGALLAVSRDRRWSTTALLVGACLGALAWPHAVDQLEAQPQPFAAGMALVGLALAGLGALPSAAAGLLRGPGLARLTLLPLVAVLAAGFLLPHPEVRPLSPWQRFETVAELAIDTRLGLLTVEPTPLGTPILTLDRVALTPTPEQVLGDDARLHAALDLAAANWRPGDPDLEVLFAGQLTMSRLEAFEAWRAASPIDARLTWTTPWDAWQARIRPLLEGSWELPAPLPFDTAQERLGSGLFDLVVVPLAFGTEVTAMEALDRPRAAAPLAARPKSAQPAVVWLSASAPLASVDLGAWLLPGGVDLDHLGLAMVAGLEAPGLVPAGAPARGGSTLGRLAVAPELRPLHDRAALFTRLASAGDDAFLAALSGLFDLQRRSSPWAKPEERFELEQAQLEALAAATVAPLTGLQKITWGHLSQVLVTKRMSGESFAVLPGLLETVGSFPPAEHALARAYFEMLMPAEGTELLLPLFEAGWRAPGPMMDLGWALGQGGDWAKAAEVYGAVLEQLPGFHHAERLQAMAELRGGLPGATEHLQELLEEDPDDQELRELLLPGPRKPVGTDFDPTPLSSLDDGHDEH